MNTKQLIAAVITLAAAASSFAQSSVPSPTQQSGLSRADVVAEYVRARANGEIAQNDWDYPVMPANAHPASRAQVLQELYTAQKNGEIDNSNLDYPQAPASNSKLTRAEVRAEYLRALQNGEIPRMETN